MLILQSRMVGSIVASVQAGHPIGSIAGIVLQPKDLKVAAFVVDTKISSQLLYLHVEDILEARNKGVLINHNQQLMEADDLIRLGKLLDIDFQIIDKQVVDTQKRKVGKAADYVVNTNGWLVQKIHTEPSMLKMLNRPDTVIDRTQIKQVTDTQIIVFDGTIPAKNSLSQAAAKQMAMRKLQTEPSTATTNSGKAPQ